MTACITQRGEPVDWSAALDDWNTVRLGKTPSEAFAWALTLDNLLVASNSEDAAKIEELSKEYYPQNFAVLKSDFREDFWERFDHGSGWQLGIFYNSAGYTQCLMWNEAARINDFAFMRGEVTGDMLWNTFVNTPSESGLWRSFGASFGAGPQTNLASVTFTGVVLEANALADAPRSMLMLKTYHYVEGE